MNAPTAQHVLDTFFLEARCKLLDVAAILDRIGRASSTLPDDKRMRQLIQAVNVLNQMPTGRAETIQQIFSLEYDPHWAIPQPK